MRHIISISKRRFILDKFFKMCCIPCSLHIIVCAGCWPPLPMEKPRFDISLYADSPPKIERTSRYSRQTSCMTHETVTTVQVSSATASFDQFLEGFFRSFSALHEQTKKKEANLAGRTPGRESVYCIVITDSLRRSAACEIFVQLPIHFVCARVCVCEESATCGLTVFFFFDFFFQTSRGD